MTAAADPRIARLAEMGECAHRLGKAYGAAAQQALGTDAWREYFQAFDRCFFSVRVALALELRLERSPAVRAEAREPVSDREDLSDRETLIEPADSALRYEPEYDRERDRETERASFPILIRTLEGVVADAAKLPGPEPAELPTLRELLAHVRSEPAAPRTAPPKAPVASANAPTPTRRPASNVAEVLAARRATGPPRR
jgi:hypothetical protein